MLDTDVELLEGCRLKIAVVVAPAEFERAATIAGNRLGRAKRITGGKARARLPLTLLYRRLGVLNVRAVTLRIYLRQWAQQAVDEAGVRRVGALDVQVPDEVQAGRFEAVRFTVEGWRRPVAVLPEFDGMEVPRRRPVVGEEQVAEQMARFAAIVGREPVDDDALAEGYRNLAELRAGIEESLRAGEASMIANDFREVAVRMVADRCVVEMPDALIEARARELAQEMAGYMPEGKADIDEMTEGLLGQAMEGLREDAVVEAIVAREGLSVPAGEFDERVEELARSKDIEADEARDIMEQSGELERLRNRWLARAAGDRVAARVRAVER
jgi:FKBP-type peptidyl-prolyl cis-trans isomerase (trigger factor)